MRAVYNGHETLTFSDYLDLGTGRTLLAEPGGEYDMSPVAGRPVDEIPAPWFTAAGEDWEHAPEPEAEPEPESEPEPPASEQGTEEGPSF